MLSVDINSSAKYEVLIGEKTVPQMAKYVKKVVKPCKALIISDDIVYEKYGAEVEKSFASEGFDVSKIIVKNGESSKSIANFEQILEYLADNNFSRSDLVIALGGGVIGDLSGFSAAAYGRGMPYIQIPTTLLAAVDSSVGGKTAVNLKSAKNMCGAFHQPKLVLCDIDIIKQLPETVFKDGMAEVIKYGIIADSELLEKFGENAKENLDVIIEKCVRIKSQYVQADEFDNGLRQMLNFGHTFGHVIEKLSNFTVTHGNAVAIGMAMISRAAWKLGYSEENCETYIKEILKKSGLPLHCEYKDEDILNALLSDKKRRGDEMTLVIPVKIGKCELITVPYTDLSKWVSSANH